jgi:hypothetical protein
MKIIIALLVPILVGIVVGSNLSPTIAIVILNQPTITLPIGVWLTIAIGLGLLSSLLIQLLIWLDQRLLQQQIRKLQSRSTQPDRDIFTYTSPATPAANSSQKKTAGAAPQPDNPPQTATNRFRSYRTNLAERFTRKPSAEPIIIDDRDDWAAEPVSNQQLDWEDSRLPRQQSFQSPTNSSTIRNDPQREELRPQNYSDRNPKDIERTPEFTSREVYDADFRLIQPPYKQPLETEFEDDLDLEDFDDIETDEDEDFESRSAPVKSTSPNPATPSTNLDDEDWGFDFDDRDPPVRAK